MNRLKLSDDMLLHIAKYYITDRDCLALALSGESERFTFLYGNRSRLAVGQSYFLTVESWNQFTQHHISSVSIKVLDISNIYWIPAEALCFPIPQMANLEELSIQDTQISLTHLPRIFDACQKIVKFSFTLEHTNREKFRKDLRRNFRCMKLGFSRLVHLKVLIYTCSDSNELWLILLEMLGWCRDCVKLFIKSDGSQNLEHHKFLEAELFEKICRKDLFPHLRWMGKLKSLALLGKNDFFDLFLGWLKGELAGSSNVLERMWYTTQYEDMIELFGPNIKSFVFDENEDNIELKEEKFHQLEHLSNIWFRELNHLRNLKFVSGVCLNNFKGLNEFCKSHPKLEQLNIRACFSNQEIVEDDAHQKFGYGGWSLFSLKVFSYACTKLLMPGHLLRIEGVVNHVVNACPNIEELHLQFVYRPEENIDRLNFLSKIRFHRLTTLNIVGSTLCDGSYLSQIIKNCPKLERLHLEQRSRNGPKRNMANFVNQLVDCLPEASNLRDLRLQWDHNCGEDVSYFPSLFEALLKCLSEERNCPPLERFVFLDGCWRVYDTRSDCSCPLDNLLLQANRLVEFVAKMEHLVAFCLAGIRIDRDFVKIVKERLVNEILPLRPALWFHIGKGLPTWGDPFVPRVHNDQILKRLHPVESNTPTVF